MKESERKGKREGAMRKKYIKNFMCVGKFKNFSIPRHIKMCIKGTILYSYL